MYFQEFSKKNGYQKSKNCYIDTSRKTAFIFGNQKTSRFAKADLKVFLRCIKEVYTSKNINDYYTSWAVRPGTGGSHWTGSISGEWSSRQHPPGNR